MEELEGKFSFGKFIYFFTITELDMYILNRIIQLNFKSHVYPARMYMPQGI